jgi:hypothetical protein
MGSGSSPDGVVIPDASEAFDFGSISIFPTERQFGPGGGSLGPAAASRVRAKQGGGEPLAAPIQQRMEGAFSHRFADVRVHADSEADLLNRSIGASAFTLGSDIFLSQRTSGISAPGTDRLLAHELTHVVQQRGAAPGGPLTVDPVDAPGEREAAAIAQSVSAGDATTALAPAARSVGALQREVVVPDAPAAPVAPAGPATPADVAVQNAFNPMDLNHKLLRAIDQSHVKLTGYQEATDFSAEHLSELALHGGKVPIYKRHVDFDETVGALNHLTAAQIQEVNKAYQAHEGRTLQDDLFGMGESGYPSDLTDDQKAQLQSLLGGTVAAQGASAQEQQDVASNTAMATAAEVHRLLHGDLEDEDIERVMSALRHDAKTNAAVMAAYAKTGDLRGEVFRMGPLAGQRAWKLLDGDITGADALKVSFDKARIQGIDDEIKQLQQDPANAIRMDIPYIIRDLQKERQKVVEDIEKRGEQAATEARAGAPGDATAAVQARMKAVLGDPNATAALIGGDDAAIIRAMASDDPVPKAAAQLHKLAQSDDLKAEMLTATLRGLRTEAEERAQRAFPKGDPRIESETKRLADDYFARIRDAYNSLVGGDDKKFDELVDNLGDEGDQSVNIALMQSHGKLNDVAELIFALQGDRKDTASVERVLRNKSAQEITQLKVEYFARTHRSLDYDLFGEGATHGGEANEANASAQWDYEKGGMVKVDQGKASGTSRLNLEDYMQRPDTEGGPQEAAYVLDRSEREFAYTIDNRGATGAIRDTFGNEERDLLNESIGEVRRLFIEYCNLIGWYEAGGLAMANLAIPPSVYASGAIHLVAPPMVQSPQAQALIVQMRMARATIRGDRDAYEKATAALRAIFEAIAVFVIQAALTALLSPAAAALLEAAELAGEAVEVTVMTARIAKFAASTTVNVASTIGANLAVHGSDYSVAMLKADLLSGVGGSIGSAAVGKMLGPVAKGLTQKLGPKASQELIALAETAGNIEGGAWAQGEAGDLSLQNIVRTHIIGKAAGKLTHATGKAVGLAPEPGAQPSAAPDETATPAPEPAPQEQHAGTTPGNEPRRPPVPTGESAPAGGGAAATSGGKQPVVAEPRPSGSQGEEPGQTATTAKPKPTATEGLPPSPGSANEADKTLVDIKPVDEDPTTVDTKPAGEEPTAVGAPPVDEEPTLIDWEPDIAYEVPAGSAIWFDSPRETYTAYNESIRKDTGKEVAIYRNRKTGQIVMVQGTENRVPLDLKVVSEALPGPPASWELETHYHPINEQTGVTRLPHRFPTGANGDFAVLEWQAKRWGNRAQTSRIDYIVEGDKRGYTEYRYEPGTDKPYKINYPEPVSGERVPIEFATRAEYEQWYRENFPNYEAALPAPQSAPAGGVAPGAPTSSEGGGGSGESGGETPGSGDFADEAPTLTGFEDEEPTQVDQNPGEQDETARNNAEIDQLVRGEGVVRPPETREEIERSNTEAILARRILQNPNATPEQILDAFEALAERSIAEGRAFHQQRRLGTPSGEPGRFRTLSAEDLALCCGVGRDITTEALITAIGNSPHEIRIERIQASHLGIGSTHSFSIVTLPNGTRYLIDPTFAQFANRTMKTFTAENMFNTTEGSAVARDLIRDGMVPLTDDAMRQYVIGLGADPLEADGVTAHLLSGRATLVTEIVRNGQAERFVGRPDKAYNEVNTVSDQEYSPVDWVREMFTYIPADHPHRPLLVSLLTRLQNLAVSGRLPPLLEP